MNSGHRLSACPGPFANIRESRLQNHCVNQSTESRTNDCTGILYSDSEFMDLTPFLILAPPVVHPEFTRIHRMVLNSNILEVVCQCCHERRCLQWHGRRPEGSWIQLVRSTVSTLPQRPRLCVSIAEIESLETVWYCRLYYDMYN